ncbi:hypothetical protein [Methyloradius palustris]|uniref:Uncharacterized protein n=1 Tax=Methyloradius palustris TaxID=2778876 RepID=A0A8D5K204_9PROT|nr:hypothetical protein [Methyloradius palustris]BCM26248.1 hypothetical protein ZMTM_25070 [Methyloradius palustris]
MPKTNVSSDFEVHLHNNEVNANHGNTGWKDGLTLEIFLTVCLIALMTFIFVAITYRLLD